MVGYYHIIQRYDNTQWNVVMEYCQPVQLKHAIKLFACKISRSFCAIIINNLPDTNFRLHFIDYEHTNTPSLRQFYFISTFKFQFFYKTNLISGRGTFCNYQHKRNSRNIDLKVRVSSLHFEHRKSRIRLFYFGLTSDYSSFKGKLTRHTIKGVSEDSAGTLAGAGGAPPQGHGNTA